MASRQCPNRRWLVRDRSVVIMIRNVLAALVAGAIGMRVLAAILAPLIPLLIGLLVMSMVIQLMTHRR